MTTITVAGREFEIGAFYEHAPSRIGDVVCARRLLGRNRDGFVKVARKSDGIVELWPSRTWVDWADRKYPDVEPPV